MEAKLSKRFLKLFQCEENEEPKLRRELASACKKGI